MLKPQILLLGTVTALIIGTPSQAQYSIVGEQPASGPLHIKEVQLLNQLNTAYQRGLIDPFELANMTRDLDSIRVHEEAFRMRKQGMTEGAFRRIESDLDSFQTDLERRGAENTTTTVAVTR